MIIHNGVWYFSFLKPLCDPHPVHRRLASASRKYLTPRTKSPSACTLQPSASAYILWFAGGDVSHHEGLLQKYLLPDPFQVQAAGGGPGCRLLAAPALAVENYRRSFAAQFPRPFQEGSQVPPGHQVASRRGRCRLSPGQEQPLQAQGKTRSRAGITELGQQAVVTAAAANRRSQARHITFKDNARIIIKIPQDTKVDKKPLLQAGGPQGLPDPGQLCQGSGRSRPAETSPGFLQGFPATVDGGQQLQAPPAFTFQMVLIIDPFQGYQVLAGQGGFDTGHRFGRQSQVLENAFGHGHLAQAQPEILQTGLRQALHRQGDNLDISGHSPGANEFDAGLVKLPPAAGLGLLIAEDPGAIPQAQG
ncbi:hypothetical protein MTY_0573 [Moorella thermoacetica Y72]|uniref:Uncharacterized protein n=1 Tax=Moorella thermoacetica Y72 TaxID=1325331 RepID=A0A0S6UE25_NEOTH|nr:hypothetical protein MTY_0573 [Moorella thermoacetica Y72]